MEAGEGDSAHMATGFSVNKYLGNGTNNEAHLCGFVNHNVAAANRNEMVEIRN